MDYIQIKMLGTPEVIKNNKKILFPFKKAEALFYYLIIEKQATREELVELLWGNTTETAGRKNLRNAMYQIRKTLDTNIIISPKRRIVKLNPDISLEINLDFINDNYNELGEFLQGFTIDKAPKFEEWMLNKKEYYKSLYIKKIHNNMKQSLQNKKFDDVEKCAKLLINLDEFNEEAYRALMQVYKNKGLLNKSILIYNKLTEVLQRELGVSPELKTRKLYNDILYTRNNSYKLDNEDFFYGRHKELYLLEENYNNFINDIDFKSVIIYGEAGIGKTKLSDKFLDTVNRENVYILQTACYQAEREYILKPWHSIVSKLRNIIKNENVTIPYSWKKIICCIFPGFISEREEIEINPIENIDTLKYQIVEDTMIELLKTISKNKKIILSFDDLQWIDDMSLSLLRRVVLQEKSKNIIFIGTCRNINNQKINTFISSALKDNKLLKITLNRFNKTEVMDFIDNALPNKKLDIRLKEKVYKETEGNTFFLVEFLNSIKEKGNVDFMTLKMQDILKSRFADISQEGKNLLHIISLFFDEANLKILIEATGKREIEIINQIEELKNKFIIKEEINNSQIAYRFTHQKLREFVYLQQPIAKRVVFHNKIATILEKGLEGSKRDVSLYSKLIYHFSKAGNRLKELQYTIENTNVYLDFAHELFPVLNSNYKKTTELYIDNDKAKKYLNNIELMLKQIKNEEYRFDKVARFEIAYLYMKGRYLIRQGEYEEGIKFIENVIKYAKKINEYKYILKGHKQIIYYSIQVHDIELMDKHVKLGLKVANDYGYEDEKGILLRLKGLNKMMTGEYDEALSLFKDSIDVLSKLDLLYNKYSLNIAASYNYIGEIKRLNIEFSNALEYYDKAIKICEDNEVLKGTGIFNINAGQGAFEMGDYYRAKMYFKKALKVYEKFGLSWGRCIGEGYMALLLCKEGFYSDALKSLKRADKYARKLKSPYELGIVYRIKAELRLIMKRNDKMSEIFEHYLVLSVAEYCDRGIKLLKKVRESYEVNILKVLKKAGEEG
ncbi:AAA family ATPase [Caldisalinibacter kiritimatiensis]|uniref:Adenylate cyclase / Guanylate cyclase n=1 Tax=Caldisalinibacter kiritimatiensis TaxID=1304284 RepID=R1ATN8_9FIRM|nr:AAA family ATPase [Caldisalinibacter kiritimatiensis]EOC99986.1 Adenylate cyclase / Guanylate cyclase [Caldisalinibacter kiritimatiensis]